MPRKVKISKFIRNRPVTRSVANLGRRVGLNYNRISRAMSSLVLIERNLHADALGTLTLPPRPLQRAMSAQVLPLINDEQVVQPLRRMSMSVLQKPTPLSLNGNGSETNRPIENIKQQPNSAISQETLDLHTTESEQVVVTEDRNPNQFDVPEPMVIDDENSLATNTEIEYGFGNTTVNVSFDTPEPMDIDEEEIVKTSPTAQSEDIDPCTVVSSFIESVSHCIGNSKDVCEIIKTESSKQANKKVAIPVRPNSAPPVLSLNEMKPKNSPILKREIFGLEKESNKENSPPNSNQKSNKPFKIRGRRPSFNSFFRMETIAEDNVIEFHRDQPQCIKKQ